jgi:mono/diheme cytochrome c family protein
MKSILRRTGIFFVGLFVLVVFVGLILYRIGMKKLDQTYPNLAVETVNNPTDADSTLRGKHIATIWMCTRCHGEDLSGMVIAKDPLSGNVPLVGTIIAPNLTSGRGGIAASYSDTDWIRAIRHGVMPDGHVEVLMFDYSTMSDQDLGDLMVYLKQLPPVHTNFPDMSYGPIVPIVSNVGVLRPAAVRIDHNAPRPTDLAPAATVEYGGYLSVICTACHGNGIGNIVNRWKQEEFIQTLNTGVLSNGKQFGPTMSSDAFREMTDIELSALWLYFKATTP